MDIALIIFGVLVLAILLVWAYTTMSDPKDIDQTEEAEVRAETPGEHERAHIDEVARAAQRNQEDITLYSPGDSGGE